MILDNAYETPIFANLKKLEPIVMKQLQRNIRARKDDFILYGSVLKELGFDLKNTSLYEFLANAKQLKVPPFESVTRCRRKVQENYPELAEESTQINRKEAQVDYKEFNRIKI